MRTRKVLRIVAPGLLLLLLLAALGYLLFCPVSLWLRVERLATWRATNPVQAIQNVDKHFAVRAAKKLVSRLQKTDSPEDCEAAMRLMTRYTVDDDDCFVGGKKAMFVELKPLLFDLGRLEAMQTYLVDKLGSESSRERHAAVFSLQWFPADFALPRYLEAISGPDINAWSEAATHLALLWHRLNKLEASYLLSVQGALDKRLRNGSEGLWANSLGTMAHLGSKEALRLLAARPIDPEGKWGTEVDHQDCFNAATGLKLSRKEQAQWIRQNFDRIYYDVKQKKFLLRETDRK